MGGWLGAYLLVAYGPVQPLDPWRPYLIITSVISPGPIPSGLAEYNDIKHETTTHECYRLTPLCYQGSPVPEEDRCNGRKKEQREGRN